MLLSRRAMLRLLRTRNLLAVTIFLMVVYVIRLQSYQEPRFGPCCKVVPIRRAYTQAKTINYSRDLTTGHVESCSKMESFKVFEPNSTNRIDWHNYTQISYEAQREGVGEQGKAVNVSADEGMLRQQMYYVNGFNAPLSDKIALDRSLPDLRHPGCKNKLYLESLPAVSVIIPFYNEHWSTLMRSVRSVLGRAPARLVREVLLIDDGSLSDGLIQRLDEYYAHSNVSKVRVIHLPKRVGLVGSSRVGAQHARADVLVFFASHAEANVNWLPPLLEPIALDPKVLVFPYTDIVAHDTFEYRANDAGARGAFNWELFYKRLPLLPIDLKRMPEPFPSPVMAGNVFAISRTFFWELGGYDPGLSMWGGEQYELSFKIWMCGGRVLNAPCSRVGQIFCNYLNNMTEDDYISKNLRRVADVWMDEYADHVYNRLPHLRHVDPGDLLHQQSLRRRLRCKTFKWFMTQVAFDVPPKYPPVLPKHFAEGLIRSVQDPTLCLDGYFSMMQDSLKLKPCLNSTPSTQGMGHAGYSEQRFEFTWYKDIRSKARHIICLDVPESAPTSPILLLACHHSGGNQQWKYHQETKQIVHFSESCLDYNVTAVAPYIMPCDSRKLTQKWKVDVVHQDMMTKWDETRAPVTGTVEYAEVYV